MRLAVISDIHSNLEAFQAVMDGKQAGILVETITDRPALRLVARAGRIRCLMAS